MDTLLSTGSPVASSERIGDHLVPDTSLLPEAWPATRETPRTAGAWLEGVRHTVTTHPLAAVATAFVLGSLIVRMRR